MDLSEFERDYKVELKGENQQYIFITNNETGIVMRTGIRFNRPAPDEFYIEDLEIEIACDWLNEQLDMLTRHQSNLN